MSATLCARCGHSHGVAHAGRCHLWADGVGYCECIGFVASAPAVEEPTANAEAARHRMTREERQMAKLTVPDPLPSSFGYVPAPASAPSASESTPDWILPARQHESRFTEGDLNVLRDMGTPRVKALVAIIDGLRVSSSGGRGQPQKTDLG